MRKVNVGCVERSETHRSRSDSTPSSRNCSSERCQTHFSKKQRKNLLVKGPLRHLGVAVAVLASVAVAGGSRLGALPPGSEAVAPGISVVAEGRSERWIVDLGGVLVAALSPEVSPGEEGLLLLVRPPRKPDGPRRLLRLRLEPEARLEVLAEGLSGWIESLSAVELDPGLRVHLVAGGAGRWVDLGPLAAQAALAPEVAGKPAGPPGVVERPLLDLGGHDLRQPGSGTPEAGDGGRFRRRRTRPAAALESGWHQAGTRSESTQPGKSAEGLAMAMSREVALPFAVARTSTGLRLTSPPVVSMRSAAGELYFAGPEVVGGTRLRGVLIDGGATGAPPVEVWAALPGPEAVEQSWPFEIDGVPVLVVRTQATDELNLFERQRLRVLTLSADRTRSGSPPTLAVELDSKRWHETALALGDVDGDGHDDLLAAFPEGLSGTDLVVQWWRGSGGGRFESRPRRSDIQKAPAGWALVPEPEPGLLLVGNGRIELRRFAAAGRSAVADRGELAASIPALAGPKAPKEVTVALGGGGDSAKVKNVDPDAEPLGAVELDGRPGPELLAVQGDGNGRDRLILLRALPSKADSPSRSSGDGRRPGGGVFALEAVGEEPGTQFEQTSAKSWSVGKPL